MGGLLGSKGGRIVFGLLAIAAALIFGFIPHTEHYRSVVGLGTLDVNCGSVAHRQVQVDANLAVFDGAADAGELNTLPVFEGKTAAQVCDGSLSSAKTYTIVAAVVGGIVLLFGFATPGRSRNPVLGMTSARSTPAPATPVRRPPSRPAQGRGPPANPSWAQPTPPNGSSVAPLPDPVSLPTSPPRPTTSGPVPFASKPPQNRQPPPIPPTSGPAAVHPTESTPSVPNPSVAPPPVPLIPISYPVSLSIPSSSAALPPPSQATAAIPLPNGPANATEPRIGQPPPVRFTVVFSNGERVNLVDTLVVGRDPDARTRAASHTIDDPLLSKTHLTIGQTTNGHAWVEDRGSINGTEVHSARGETIEVVAGVRVPISTDSTVSFGDSSFVIERG